MSIAHLYKITNNTTGEYYVGKHNGVDQTDHRGNLYWGSGRRITKQVKKHGTENFIYEILVIGNKDYIFELEKNYITQELIESDEKCLNLTTGGNGVSYHSPKMKKYISEKVKEVFANPEIRKQISDRQKKYFRDNPEAAQKQADKLRGRKQSAENIEKRRKGLILNYINHPEVKEKISKKLKGRIIPDNVRKKISASSIGKKNSPEAILKIKAARAKQVFTEETYEKSSKTMSTLTWMNDGTRSYRVKPEKLQAAKEKGYVAGRLMDYLYNKQQTNRV
jgi:hypothetical protein